MVLIYPFIVYVVQDDYLKGGIILVISGISDILDGFIARKFEQASKLGRILDPVADKLTLISVMICVGLKFNEMKLPVVILVAKEIIMILAGAFLLKKNRIPPAAKWYGKLATVWFYVSSITIICLKFIWGIQNLYITFTLMSTTVLLMIYAMYKYIGVFLQTVKTFDKN
jgi:cardiolipin synthase